MPKPSLIFESFTVHRYTVNFVVLKFHGRGSNYGGKCLNMFLQAVKMKKVEQHCCEVRFSNLHPNLYFGASLFFFFLMYVCIILNIYLFIYLFLAVLGLRFCARAFSSCGKRGPLFIVVRGPLTIAASRCGAQTPVVQAQ